MTGPLVDLRRTGNRLLAQRDFEGAEEVFRRLIVEHPSESDGYVGLATVLERSDRHEELVQVLEPVLEQLSSQQLLRQLADACRVLANRGRTEFTDRAVEYYEQLRKFREDPVSLFYLADLLFKKKKDYERALAFYRMSWDKDPRSQQAYMGVLNSLRKLGRMDEIEQMKELWKERKG
jgi:tetratricopeptide (TPR) repeat protein